MSTNAYLEIRFSLFVEIDFFSIKDGLHSKGIKSEMVAKLCWVRLVTELSVSLSLSINFNKVGLIY